MIVRSIRGLFKLIEKEKHFYFDVKRYDLIIVVCLLHYNIRINWYMENVS